MTKTTTASTSPRAPSQKWTAERCLQEAMKYSTKTEWHSKGAGSYRKAKNTRGWFDACTAHMITPNAKKEPYKWTKEKCLEEAAKHDEKIDWLEASPSSYRAAERYNWMNECTQGMKKRTYWTEQTCFAEAAKHKSLTAWQQEGKGSYRFAKNQSNNFFETCSKLFQH